MAENLGKALKDKNRMNMVFDSIVENFSQSIDQTRLRCVFDSIIGTFISINLIHQNISTVSALH
jgi:hypothetical protein